MTAVAIDPKPHEPTDRPMKRTYWLVVLVEILVVAGLWVAGWYFGS